ncbi:MAG: hypothetical protein U9N73_10480 [Candidatus Auribacterota bacterium]|nr:hypothetical protein [Candidatus Auribacterota bacterium]
MKMENNKQPEDDLRPEYDFSKLKGGVRGKYAERFHAGSNLIRLEPDVAKAFTDDASVNATLRALIELARTRVKVAQ